MNPAEEKTAILKVDIADPARAGVMLEKWSRRVSLNVLRGRVTPENATYELEIRGNAANVARIVRQSAPWDAARRFLNRVPTGALA